MDEYQVELSAQAEQDILEIHAYIQVSSSGTVSVNGTVPRWSAI